MQSTSPQPYPEFYANIWKNTRPNRAANPTFGIEILKAAFEDDFVGDGEEFAVVDLGAGVRVASKVEAPVPGGPVVEELLAIFEEPIAVVEDALATMGGLIIGVGVPLAVVEYTVFVSSAKSAWLQVYVLTAAPLKDSVNVTVSSGAVHVVAILPTEVLIASREESLSKVISQYVSKVVNV